MALTETITQMGVNKNRKTFFTIYSYLSLTFPFLTELAERCLNTIQQNQATDLVREEDFYVTHHPTLDLFSHM